MADRIETLWTEVSTEQYSDAVMAAMKLGGVDHLWFCSGSELAFFQEASARAKALGLPTPRIVTSLHEHAALCCAMGESMVTGKPSAVCAHVELGLMNMGGAIQIAYRGDYPILLISGYPPSAYPGTVAGARDNTVFWQQQQWDQGQIVRQYVKWDHKLGVYDNPALTTLRALQVAMTPQRGPVYLAIPREVGMTGTGGTTRFPGPDLLGPAPGPVPDPVTLKQAAKLLARANRPVIVAERSGRAAEAVTALGELALLIGAEVFAAGHKMNIADSTGLKIAQSRGPSPDLSHADVVFVVDKQVPWIPGPLGPNADCKIIMLDMDPIQRRIPIYEFPAHVRLMGDSAATLPLLTEEIRGAMGAEHRDSAQRRVESIRTALSERRRQAEQGALADGKLSHITRRFLAYQLGQAIDPETVVVSEMADSSFIRREKAGTMFEGGGGASIGWAAAAAVGARLARPDQNFVCLSGDGAYTFSIPTAWLWNAHRYKAPTMTVIFNNRGYGTGTTTVSATYPKGYADRAQDMEGGWFDPPPNYSGEAAASGAYGEKVSDPGELAAALGRGMDAVVKDGAPAVIDVWLPKHVTEEV